MKGQALIRLILVVLILAGIGTAVSYSHVFSVDGVEGWVDSFGDWAPVLFIATYSITTLFFVPASLFTLAGGALFGPLWGAVYSLIGASLGAVLGFLIARYIASDWIAKRSGPRVTRFMESVTREGWRFVAFTRLVPVFPFMPQNYFYGASRVPLGGYTIASVVCMGPATAAYTWLGHIGMEAASGRDNWIDIGLFALAALVLVFFLPRIIGYMRR